MVLSVPILSHLRVVSIVISLNNWTSIILTFRVTNSTGFISLPLSVGISSYRKESTPIGADSFLQE